MLTTKIQDQTLIITLNRPKVLNALNTELFTQLEEAVDALIGNPELKGAIITGAGEKAFAAGADIQEFASLSQEDGSRLSKRGQDIFAKIENSPKPIIAAVNGYALGGGCELAMACHIRVAVEAALFGQPEVKLGLVPGYGGTQRLARYVGEAKAIELLITADMLDSYEALRLGLVTYVVEPQELIEKCQAILKKCYRQSPLAVARTLQAIRVGIEGGDGYAAESENFGKSIVSQDGQEGAKAFVEKRRPTFVGK